MTYIKSRLALLYSCLVVLISCGDWHELGFHDTSVLELTVFAKDSTGEEYLSPFESHHLDVYRDDLYKNYRDFAGNCVRFQLADGEYQLLIYNNDYQHLHVDYKDNQTSITAYTNEATSYVAIKDTLFPLNCNVHEMPDTLYVGEKMVFYSRASQADDYWDEEQAIFIHPEKIEIEPVVYDYKLIAHLDNNNGRIDKTSTTTISGLLPEIHIRGDDYKGESIAHQFNTEFKDDCITGHMRTFGQGRDSTQSICYLNLGYTKGGSRIIPIDISDKMKEHPHGGTIEIRVDINKYSFPTSREELTFVISIDIDIENWTEENHSFVIP